jgi:hypothetical protein
VLVNTLVAPCVLFELAFHKRKIHFCTRVMMIAIGCPVAASLKTTKMEKTSLSWSTITLNQSSTNATTTMWRFMRSMHDFQFTMRSALRIFFKESSK